MVSRIPIFPKVFYTSCSKLENLHDLKKKTFVLHFPNQSFPLVKIRVLYKQVPGLATVQYSF